MVPANHHGAGVVDGRFVFHSAPVSPGNGKVKCHFQKPFSSTPVGPWCSSPPEFRLTPPPRVPGGTLAEVGEIGTANPSSPRAWRNRSAGGRVPRHQPLLPACLKELDMVALLPACLEEPVPDGGTPRDHHPPPRVPGGASPTSRSSVPSSPRAWRSLCCANERFTGSAPADCRSCWLAARRWPCFSRSLSQRQPNSFPACDFGTRMAIVLEPGRSSLSRP